ncbi:hypothetical protein GPLA_1419 [Paraglaciecola polaris LMG 21857]|uniref:Uncharacterized protein n=1 Tax=Paraglaciecola polaris LMG 21857 TaxID=1129793 RepID=K6ZU49_9ALTE|nr:hypothetical protein GPLA_1419 [Paraglaciecola polaris LMG 21857]
MTGDEEARLAVIAHRASVSDDRILVGDIGFSQQWLNGSPCAYYPAVGILCSVFFCDPSVPFLSFDIFLRLKCRTTKPCQVRVTVQCF